MKLYILLTDLLGSVSIFDLVFFAAIIISAIYGYAKGFVRQLIAIIGIIAGTYCAYKLSLGLTNWWHGHFNVDADVMRIIVFIVLAAIIYLLVLWAAKLLDKLLKMAMLGWINRLLGLIFGAAKIILIFSALAYAIDALKLQNMETSKTYSYLVAVANYVFPYIKSLPIAIVIFC